MSSKDEIRIGGIAVRHLVEGHEANNTVAMFEFEWPPAAKSPVLTVMMAMKKPPMVSKACSPSLSKEKSRE